MNEIVLSPELRTYIMEILSKKKNKGSMSLLISSICDTLLNATPLDILNPIDDYTTLYNLSCIVNSTNGVLSKGGVDCIQHYLI